MAVYRLGDFKSKFFKQNIPIIISYFQNTTLSKDNNKFMDYKTIMEDLPSYLVPMPRNIKCFNDAKNASFSPLRTRDINSTLILSKEGKEDLGNTWEPSLASYDCFGTISLNSAMQSQVPEPFSSKGKATHWNMPGGQWSQTDKFLSEDIQYHHYYNFRNYSSKLGLWNQQSRNYSSDSINNRNTSRKEQLKITIRDYGATVIVFHITMSLMSLGGFYLAVTSGIDLNFIGNYIGSEVATEAGSFVLAYAMHKVLAPVRISITIAVTPFIVRYLRKKGILKHNTKKVNS